jgi:hypothetical protein
MNCEEVGAGRITTGNDEVGTDVTLVPEEMLLKHSHDSGDSRFAARAEGVQLDVGGDEGGGEFGVCSCASACTPYLWRDVVELLAILHARKNT